MANKIDGAQLEQELLAAFTLSPGMNLQQSCREYNAVHRKLIDPLTLKFMASCAIEAGNYGLAAIILGIEQKEGSL